MNDERMTKDEWVEVFRATGLDDEGMKRWHREFESRYPLKHEAFLEWLRLPEAEITRIRKHSRG